MPRLSVDRFMAEGCKKNYFEFFKTFWSLVSEERLQLNWHIEYLCNELQTLSERVFLNQPKEYDFITNCAPGTSKPVWEAMLVMMADGTWKKLRHIKVGDQVIGKSGRPCAVTAVHIQGELPCVRIMTAGGRKLIMAPDHPVLTADGWIEAGKLIPGRSLALMHTPRIQTQGTRTDAEFRLAGYLIGDGSLAHNSCAVTNKDPEYIADLNACVASLGFGTTVRERNGITVISLRRNKNSSPRKTGQFKGVGRGNAPKPRGPRDWCREVGIAGKNSYAKVVPDFVWHGTDSQVSQFLATYFHCDGCVYFRHEKKRNLCVSCSTVSVGLALGLQRLFLRLGVSMRIRKHVSKNGFNYNRNLKDYIYYTVETTDQDAASRFLEKIPLLGRKLRKLESFIPRRKTFEQTYWPDRVESVETIGNNACRCLTVEGDESFCVDGVVVHNSTIFSVLWQPWLWTRNPTIRFISGSYSDELALDLSRKSRDVVKSEKYQNLFGPLKIRDDQDAKGYFVNTRGGGRYATSVGGTVTGFHAHVICVDDPINPLDALSTLVLNQANIWMKETLSDRKVDKSIAVTAMVMQRLHEDDPTGNWLTRGGRLRHNCFPCDTSWEVKPAECANFYARGGLGEPALFDPNRLPKSVLDEKKLNGEAYYAGQYGQDPVPRGGSLFKVDRIEFGTLVPNKWKRPLIRFWDKSATSKGGNYTVGTKGGLAADDKVWVLDVVRGQWDSGTRERIILDTAQRDGKETIVVVEQEPASGGKESAENTVKRLTLGGFRARMVKSVTNKEVRAEPFSQYVNLGLVVLVKAFWNNDWLNEFRFFPLSRNNDQVDSGSGMFSSLTGPRPRIGTMTHYG